jgi:hypothetical protein
MKGNGNIIRSLKFSNMSSGDNNKDNPGHNNQDNNLRREFSNHDTLSLKENLKEGSVEVEKAERIEVGGDTTIRSNDI